MPKRIKQFASNKTSFHNKAQEQLQEYENIWHHLNNTSSISSEFCSTKNNFHMKAK